ncbi:MAG TPA: hypothetical protein VMW48_01420, partial [Vicinamibacterales bacterium]|nr:hypothetical protein [Vicinamibacterales bacterium]
MATGPHLRPLVKAGLVACLLLPAVAGAQRAGYLTAADVRPLLVEVGADAPPDLPAMSGPRADARWRDWIARHDAAIRSRLAEGDEDTVVNWALLGTSFTGQPPVRLDRVDGTDDRAVDRAIQAILLRVDDLMAALAAPGGDERRVFARRVFANQGLGFATATARTAVRDRLVAAIQRVMDGPASPEQRDTSAGSFTGAGAPTSEFAQRGLSLDTSLPPNFAVDESLAALKTRGLLTAGTVRRVGIIGAGLDFADKNTGFDFYPVQTLQPFAVLDSLRRLELAPATGGATVVALDISPRVI